MMMIARAANDAHPSARILNSRDALNSERTRGDFELCVMLESIGAIALESRHSSIDGNKALEKCHESLISWYEVFKMGSTSRADGKESLRMLWHSTFMLMHVDFAKLELSCGKAGPRAAQNNTGYSRAWAQSDDAKRCLVHAMLVQRHFRKMPVGSEPSIHVPMCLYLCGILLFCLLRFGGDGETHIGTSSPIDFPELRLLGIDANSMVRETIGELQSDRLGLSHVFKVIGLLQRISHWRLAQSLTSTLLTLVEEYKDFI